MKTIFALTSGAGAGRAASLCSSSRAMRELTAVVSAYGARKLIAAEVPAFRRAGGPFAAA